MAAVRLVEARSHDEIDAARTLMREYAQALNVDLCFQDFATELNGLPGDYAPASGLLLLASVDGAWAGCGAYRALAAPGHVSACEMKRLYVRPAYRGLQLGRRLARELMRRAAAAGYEAMLLDTLEQMDAARALYASLGFVDVAPYYRNPIPGTHYLKARLRDHASPGAPA